LDKAVCIAKQKGKAYLWLGVWEKNIRAIGFYSKNGFRASGEHIFVMGDEQQHDYIMKREL
jgi:ribosomal protein S18 acetylase RimI-like enzyme